MSSLLPLVRFVVVQKVNILNDWNVLHLCFSCSLPCLVFLSYPGVLWI